MSVNCFSNVPAFEGSKNGTVSMSSVVFEAINPKYTLDPS